MTSLEQQARELDNNEKPLGVNARAISKQLGASVDYVKNILSLKRRGFASQAGYVEELAKRRGFDNRLEYEAKSMGFNNWDEYLNHRAQLNGLVNLYESQKYYNKGKEGESIEQFVQRDFDEKFFKPGFRVLPNEELDIEQPNGNGYSGNPRKMIAYALKSLDKFERRVIYERFFKGKSRREIGEKLKRRIRHAGKGDHISKVAVDHIEKKALKKMRRHLLKTFYPSH